MASASATVSVGSSLPAPDAARDAIAETRLAAAEQRLFGILDLRADPRPVRPRTPTLGLRGAPRERALVRTTEAFLDNFRRLAACLEGFPLQDLNLVVAGGAAGAALYAKPAEFGDIDLFFVGSELSDPAASAAADELAEHLAAIWGDDLEICRMPEVVTFRNQATGLHVQLVLRAAASVQELLYSFDLGGGAAATDGVSVWLSAYGRLAAERALLLPNWGKLKAASFWPRVRKYMARGFRLALPDLDVAWVLAPPHRLASQELVRPELGADLAVLVDSVRPAAGAVIAERGSDYGGGHEDSYAVTLAALRGVRPGAMGKFSPGASVADIQPPASVEALRAFLRMSLARAQSFGAHRRAIEAVFGDDLAATMSTLDGPCPSFSAGAVRAAKARSFPFRLTHGWAGGEPEWALVYGERAREAAL